MKQRSRFLLLFMFFLLIGIVVSAEEINLLENGDFETGDFTSWAPYRPSGSPTIEVSNEGAKVGSYCAYLASSSPTERGAIIQISNHGLVPQQKYKVRFWAKTRGPASKEIAYFRIVALNDKKGPFSPEQAIVFQRIQGNTEWNLYEYEFILEAPASYLKLESFISAGSSDGNTKGELWLDDIEIVRCFSNGDVNNIISFLPDVGFGINHEKDLIPDGWKLEAAIGSKGHLVPREDGQGSMLLLDNGTNTEGRVIFEPLSVALNGSIPAGTRLNISGLFKAEQLQRAAAGSIAVGLQIAYVDSNGATKYLYYDFPNGTYNWRYFSVTTTLPAGLHKIDYIRLQSRRAAGKVWVQDIAFFIDLPPQTQELRIVSKDEVVLGEAITATVEALQADGSRDLTQNEVVMVGTGSNAVPVSMVAGEGKLNPQRILAEETVAYDDFEESHHSWGQIKPAGTPVFSADSQGRLGTKAAKIASSESARGWYQKEFQVTGGKYYSLSVWAKTNEVQKAYLRVKLFKGGEQLKTEHPFANQFGDIVYPELVGTFDWRRLGGWFYAPPDTTRILVELNFEGPGEVWFDDLLLETARVESIVYQGAGPFLFEAWVKKSPEIRGSKQVSIVYGSPAQLLVAANKQVGLIKTDAIFTAQVKNSYDYPVPNVPLSLRLLSGPSGSGLEADNLITDQEGKATGVIFLGDEAGICRLEASIPGASDVAAKIVAVQVVDESISVLPEKTTVSILENLPVIIKLEDKVGNPLAGRTVKLEITPETTIPASVSTDEQGEASFMIGFGNLAGEYILTATEAVLGYKETVIIRCLPGSVAEIVVDLKPSLEISSKHLSTIIEAMLADEFGNPVADGEEVEFWNGEQKLGAGETSDGVVSLGVFLPAGDHAIKVKSGSVEGVFQLEVQIPTLLSPQKKGVVLVSNVVLEWEGILGYNEYLLDCASDPEFNELFVTDKKSNENSLPLLVREEGSVYWRVKVVTDKGIITSEIEEFEVIDPGTGYVVASDSFEDTFGSWEKRQAEGSIDVATDDAIKYHGDSSVRLSSSEYARGWVAKRFNIQGGKKYIVTTWCRTETVNSASMRAKLHDAAGNQLPMPDNPFCNNLWGDLSFPGISGTNDGRKMSGWFVAPEDANSFLLELMMNGSGQVWWDLVEITEVPMDYDPTFEKDLYFVGVAPSTIDAVNPYIRYNLLFAKDAEVSIVIYDVAGRVVRNLVHNKPIAQAGSAVSAPESIEWDGKNNNGKEVNNGLYLSRIEVKIPGKRPSVIIKKIYVMR